MAKFDMGFFSFLFSLRKNETEHLMLIQIDLNENNFKQKVVYFLSNSFILF